MNLKNGKVFTSKFVRTGPLSYKKNYRAAVSQRLKNTALVLLFHLRPGLPNNLFLSDFPNIHVQQAINSLLDLPAAIITLFI
jgi:hypothetical protein